MENAMNTTLLPVIAAAFGGLRARAYRCHAALPGLLDLDDRGLRHPRTVSRHQSGVAAHNHFWINDWRAALLRGAQVAALFRTQTLTKTHASLRPQPQPRMELNDSLINSQASS
jgi:hypothetical protein